MEELIDKIAYVFMPANFVKILPYCFWQWIVMTLILLYILKQK